MNLRRSILTAALALTIVACDDGPTGPEPVVELAYINAPGEGSTVAVVSDGDRFVIDFMTWGLNTCYTRNRDDVDVDSGARVITIRPFNDHRDLVCGQAIVEIAHRVEVDPGAGGDWLVRVIGKPMITNGPQEIVVEVEAHLAILVDNPTGP